LDSLQVQTFQNFEIIVVDNGKNESIYNRLINYPILYIRLKENYKPSIARNIGTIYAKGKIVSFIDDDAIAEQNYIEAHYYAHQGMNVRGVRGKILPKTNTIYNCLAYHYNLGEEVVPSYIDMEGCASFRKMDLIEVGGFNPQVFAGEGSEISYRLIKRFGIPESLIYWPQAIIYHDFSTTLINLLRKTLRGAKMHIWFARQYPDFGSFIESYHPLPMGSIPIPRNLVQRLYLAFLRRFLNIVSAIAKKINTFSG
jgi:glycosyltransferase involved in cell wall biosynthesis